MHAVSGSGQTGRTSGKCWFVWSFMLFTVHIMLLMLPNKQMLNVWCTEVMYTGSLWVNLVDVDKLEAIELNERIILDCVMKWNGDLE